MKSRTREILAASAAFLQETDDILLSIQIDSMLESAAPGIKFCMDSRCDHPRDKRHNVFNSSRDATVRQMRPDDLDAIYYQYTVLGEHFPFGDSSRKISAEQLLVMNGIDIYNGTTEEIAEDLAEYREQYEIKRTIWESNDSHAESLEDIIRSMHLEQPCSS